MRVDPRRKLSYADYAAIPEDGKRYEVLDGGLLVTPAPSPMHQRVSFRLQRQLADFFHARALGEVFAAPIDVILSDHDVLQPDLVVAMRRDQVSKRGIEGTPELVVEILSPSTGKRDRAVKSHRYAALGVRHFWLVDPDLRRIECYRADGEVYRLVAQADGSAGLDHPDWPELWLDPAALWAE